MAKPLQDEVIAYEADRTLRKLIGWEIKLREVFTPERIEACQNQIDEACVSFYDTTKDEIVKLGGIVEGHL